MGRRNYIGGLGSGSHRLSPWEAWVFAIYPCSIKRCLADRGGVYLLSLTRCVLECSKEGTFLILIFGMLQNQDQLLTCGGVSLAVVFSFLVFVGGIGDGKTVKITSD
jgi:hypothetical protein